MAFATLFFHAWQDDSVVLHMKPSMMTSFQLLKSAASSLGFDDLGLWMVAVPFSYLQTIQYPICDSSCNLI